MVQAPSAASISAITKRVPRERHMKVLRNLHTQHDILNCDVLLTDQNQSQQAGMFSCAWQSMYPQSCDLRRTVWSNSFQLIQNLVRPCKTANAWCHSRLCSFSKPYLGLRNVEMHINFWIESFIWEEIWMPLFAVSHVTRCVKCHSAYPQLISEMLHRNSGF